MKTNKTAANSKKSKFLLPAKILGALVIGLFLGYELNAYSQNFTTSAANKRVHATHYQRAEEILRYIDARYVKEEALDSLQKKARGKSLF